ncbi:MAG: hypothetical protein ACM3KE_14220, partial [Hyphomicrobiales bacterium]
HYKAALARFRVVVSDFPDVGYHQPALDYIKRCEKLIAEEKTELKDAVDAPPDQGPLSPDNG